MFNLCASGQRCGTDRLSVSMHKRTQSLLSCFVIGSVQLLLRVRRMYLSSCLILAPKQTLKA